MSNFRERAILQKREVEILKIVYDQKALPKSSLEELVEVFGEAAKDLETAFGMWAIFENHWFTGNGSCFW